MTTSSHQSNRSSYRRALEQVVQAVSMPLDMASLKRVTPHLNKEQRRSLLVRVASYEKVYVGAPALAVADSYFILVLAPGFGHGGKAPFPAHISVVKAKRCPEFDPAREAEFASEALAYARDNWGSLLKDEIDGEFHRHEVADEILAAAGIPIKPRDLVTVEFVTSPVMADLFATADDTPAATVVDGRIAHIFDAEIDCIEQRRNRPRVLWETPEVPARVMDHLRKMDRKAA